MAMATPNRFLFRSVLKRGGVKLAARSAREHRNDPEIVRAAALLFLRAAKSDDDDESRVTTQGVSNSASAQDGAAETKTRVPPAEAIRDLDRTLRNDGVEVCLRGFHVRTDDGERPAAYASSRYFSALLDRDERKKISYSQRKRLCLGDLIEDSVHAMGWRD